jgi:hypothetical protein
MRGNWSDSAIGPGPRDGAIAWSGIRDLWEIPLLLYIGVFTERCATTGTTGCSHGDAHQLTGGRIRPFSSHSACIGVPTPRPAMRFFNKSRHGMCPFSLGNVPWATFYHFIVSRQARVPSANPARIPSKRLLSRICHRAM